MGACHSTKTHDPREDNHHYRTQHLSKKNTKNTPHPPTSSTCNPPTMSPSKPIQPTKDELMMRPKHSRCLSAPLQSPSESVFITNIQSHIGRATVRALTSTNPVCKIRGGVSSIPTSPYLDGHRVDLVRCDIRKRQSMIWDLIGVQTLLITPCANDVQYLAALFIVAAAKVAGVKFVAVVSMPDIHGHPKTGAASPTSIGTTQPSTSSSASPPVVPQQPNVIEQAVLKAKLDCCFIRLPFFIDDEELTTEQILRQEGTSQHTLSFSALTDIGTACASILNDYTEHINAQYDMSPSAYHDAYTNNNHNHPSTATTANPSVAHSVENSKVEHLSALTLAGLTTSVPPQPKSRSPSITPREESISRTSDSHTPSYSESDTELPTKSHVAPLPAISMAYAQQSHHTHPHPPRHAHTARRMENNQ